MIHKEVIPDKPPKAIYSLTTFGQSIIPVLDAMYTSAISLKNPMTSTIESSLRNYSIVMNFE